MPFPSTRAILQKVKSGKLSITNAEKVLKLDAISIVGEIARLDLNRHLRRGVPEIIYAAGKSDHQLKSILGELLDGRVGTENTPIILSKVSKERVPNLRRIYSKRVSKSVSRNTKFRYHESSGIVSITYGHEIQTNGGRVALLAAGTSDIPALDEAEVILSLMGCNTIRFNDVGVATLQRLRGPLVKIQRFDPDVMIVAAGMEAALPSVIAGLSSVPVVGLPTSVGFGFGGRGEAALMSMLQACPLGICTVNIDGGVAAGIVSWLIAKRCGEAREGL